MSAGVGDPVGGALPMDVGDVGDVDPGGDGRAAGELDDDDRLGLGAGDEDDSVGMAERDGAGGADAPGAAGAADDAGALGAC